MRGNFGYMGRSNAWGDLYQMWHVGRYGGRNHGCIIWLLSVKGCGCGEKQGLKCVFSDTKCTVDFVKCSVDFAGVCYVK